MLHIASHLPLTLSSLTKYPDLAYIWGEGVATMKKFNFAVVLLSLFAILLPACGGGGGGGGVDTPAANEFTTLSATDAETGDWYGYSVSVNGTTAAVGALFEDGIPASAITDSGSVYIHYKDQGGVDNWGGLVKVRTTDAQAWDSFGESVSLRGDLLISGAAGEDGGSGSLVTNAGAAYIFHRNWAGGFHNWGQVKKLSASDLQIGDHFGRSVSIDVGRAVVGAPNEDGGPGNPRTDAGAVYVYHVNQGGTNNWGIRAQPMPSDAQSYDNFGQSVSVSSQTLIVGAPGEDGGAGSLMSGAGAAYIFTRDQGGLSAYGQVKKLTASDAQADDRFGTSVFISGDYAIVGADGVNGGTGAAYIFYRDHGGTDNWGEVAKLVASDAQAVDNFGKSVAIDGDNAIVGAPGEDGGVGGPLNASGAAYIFNRNQGGADNWGETSKIMASDAQDNDYFGKSVSISGSTKLVGADNEDGGAGDPLSNSGAAYLF